MRDGRHRVHRQVIEIVGCPPDEVSSLQQRVRDVFYARMLPAVEAACAALDEPARLRCIDRLEIDLTGLPVEGLETALASAFEDRVRACLAEALGQGAVTQDAGGSSRSVAAGESSPVELLATFLLTGVLPWWADRSDRWIVESALALALREAPDDLLDFLLQEGAAWSSRAHGTSAIQGWPLARRLVSACREPSVARLVAWLLGARGPASAGRAKASTVSGKSPVGHLDVREESLREIVAIVAAGAARSGSVVTPGIVWQTLILAAATGVQANGGTTPMSPTAAADVLAGAIASLAARAGGSQPASLAHAIGAWARETRRPDRTWAEAFAATVAALTSTGHRFDREPGAASVEGRDAPDARGRSGRATTPGPEPWGAAHRDERDHARRADRGGPAVDALAVDNAGLVILWPFLERLFDRMGLLEDRVFRDEAARRRGAAALHHVATGEHDAPEFQLVLEKVLCGMAPDEVCESGPPLTAEEADECEGMLTAAIHQAPILNDMSIPGFRASFLWREGQLRTRDGHWLLRVPRETHDVVLDRFPWSFSVLGFPWMDARVQVEWR